MLIFFIIFPTGCQVLVPNGDFEGFPQDDTKIENSSSSDDTTKDTNEKDTDKESDNTEDKEDTITERDNGAQ